MHKNSQNFHLSVTHEYYRNNLEMIRDHVVEDATFQLDTQEVDATRWDPILGARNERLILIDLKDADIFPLDHQVTKLGTPYLILGRRRSLSPY